MTGARDLLVATHEASHAVMARVLGVRAGFISIRPAANFGGVCRHGTTGIPTLRDDDLDGSVVDMRASLRRGLEKLICITLAGELGVQYLLPPDLEDGFTEVSPDREQAERLAEIASLNRREAAALATTEHDGVEESDAAHARRKAWALAGGSLAARYVLLLEGVAIELIASPRFRKLVDAIVPPLIEHRVLSGRAVRAILTEADTTKEFA